MTQRCRLLARAQIGAALLEPGTEFSLKDGEIGPCKTTMYAHETIDLAHDSRRVPPEYVDEPRYEVFVGGKWQKPTLSAKG